MSERDLDKNPYSPDEHRVAAFFFERGTGGGDDPITAILASHQYLAEQRKVLLEALIDIIAVTDGPYAANRARTALAEAGIPVGRASE